MKTDYNELKEKVRLAIEKEKVYNNVNITKCGFIKTNR